MPYMGCDSVSMGRDIRAQWVKIRTSDCCQLTWVPHCLGKEFVVHLKDDQEPWEAFKLGSYMIWLTILQCHFGYNKTAREARWEVRPILCQGVRGNSLEESSKNAESWVIQELLNRTCGWTRCEWVRKEESSGGFRQLWILVLLKMQKA